MAEQFLNTRQVAGRLAISEGACRKWMRKGKLPALRLGKEWRMIESDLIQIMQKGAEWG